MNGPLTYSDMIWCTIECALGVVSFILTSSQKKFLIAKKKRFGVLKW